MQATVACVSWTTFSVPASLGRPHAVAAEPSLRYFPSTDGPPLSPVPPQADPAESSPRTPAPGCRAGTHVTRGAIGRRPPQCPLSWVGSTTTYGFGVRLLERPGAADPKALDPHYSSLSLEGASGPAPSSSASGRSVTCLEAGARVRLFYGRPCPSLLCRIPCARTDPLPPRSCSSSPRPAPGGAPIAFFNRKTDSRGLQPTLPPSPTGWAPLDPARPAPSSLGSSIPPAPRYAPPLPGSSPPSPQYNWLF